MADQKGVSGVTATARQGRALIVAGPTASGKSALALAIARELGGTIINSDAMQVYRELRVLTARPSPADEMWAPHLLYGVRAAHEPGSVGWWRSAALAAMAEAHRAGRLPILCGGSGLYLAALVGGLVEMPEPDPSARAEARTLLAELGPTGLHTKLARVDRMTAERLCPTDGQRIARAWEVWRATGRGLAKWQACRASGTADWRFAAVLLDPPRAILRAEIAARFHGMLRAGACDEVATLLSCNLDPTLPVMRAHGVPELAAHLRGEITLEEAARRGILATGRYTKRQATWFRHHALAPADHVRVIEARIAEPDAALRSALRAACAVLDAA